MASWRYNSSNSKSTTDIVSSTVKHSIPWLCGLLFALCISPSVSAQELPAYDSHLDLTYFLDNDGNKTEISSVNDWRHRRHHILAHMQTVMGKLPRPEQKVPLAIKIIKTEPGKHYKRSLISYHTDDEGRRVHAYLLVPNDIKKNEARAGVLCLHQTTGIGKEEPTGLGGNPNLHYAHHLAERGFVTLAPDYPSFGDYSYEFPAADGYVSGTMKAIYDNIRAIDLLSALPEVDADRIGCIGHSLGGHNTMFTAAFDIRIKALVSNCGFTRFHKYYEGRLKGWTSNRYMPLINDVYTNNPDKVPFDFPEIIGCFAPRAFLASAPVRDGNFEVSGVRDSIRIASSVYELLGVPEKLQAIYPDSAHDFPAEARDTAYKFLEQHLNNESAQ